jgi:hypothetical protein
MSSINPWSSEPYELVSSKAVVQQVYARAYLVTWPNSPGLDNNKGVLVPKALVKPGTLIQEGVEFELWVLRRFLIENKIKKEAAT